ncbi:sodium-dependent nutrient amino acid transporter 1-like isoform X1 [Bactrocera tryoni]|uniref:sodium-dependent nutrient amino acid transporter 1-like isoform X1 n=1 Tax=Bactrocera tryoni TaxID=59916 RepID=UPI001A95D17E|nr:sodium-dependent nutrient amino acid transporter 1-like isoform X1 [Bactrocera tryoni]
MTAEEELLKLQPRNLENGSAADAKNVTVDELTAGSKSKEQWGNEIEFLFSCISLSVGLGNIWRFPYIAFQNGGGAFVIPYLIVLLIIGRPVYYLEIILGQFSGRGCIKAFNMAPIMKGVAAGQVLATGASITYYSSIMALTLRFLIASFSTVLPWSYCREEWGDSCLNETASTGVNVTQKTVSKMSSAELYFQKEILHEQDDIFHGLGMPNWELVGCLAVAWFIIGGVLIRGVKSSGKAAYFLGVFPYVVLLVLLLRAVTLPGAMDGIIYFFKPQWSELLNPLVWYAAVTQVFFSLAICFGTLITYASYNNFSRNVYKDIVIITTMDSCSSIIAGCITFGILGNLAFKTGAADVASVVKGGAGLAFISYPDAIAKFEFIPQAFAVLFFLMLFVLGIGSTVGMGSCIVRVIRDRWVRAPNWTLALSLAVLGFAVSIVYMTPGGQFVLNLVDFYGVSFTALILAIGELLAVGWVYGVKRFCADIEFMIGLKTGIYWRICWGLITPGLMLAVLIYTLVDLKPLTYKNVDYPRIAHVFGWCLSAIGLLQIPGWALYSICKQSKSASLLKKFKAAAAPANAWGPLEKTKHEEYVNQRRKFELQAKQRTILQSAYDNLFG